MSQIKIITEWIDGTATQLDVDQNTAITLKMQLIQITDIEKRSGDYTKSFALPRTVDNDLFFGNWGDPSTIGGNWNTRVEAPAYILEDDNIVIQGILRLESTDPESNKYYISISGNVATIKSILGEGKMSNLDMSPWIYTATQIFSTWNGSLFSGDMIFPIHDFGFGWGLYKKTGTANVLQDFQTPVTPIILDQCIPAFRLTKLIEMIFNEKGITVEGSFLSETNVDDIYVQADTALQSFGMGAGLVSCGMGTRTILDATLNVINWAASPSSPDFNNTTHRYTAPVAGDYYFDFNVMPIAGSPASQAGTWYLRKNGITAFSGGMNWIASFSGTNLKVTMVAGDYVDMAIQMAAGVTVDGSVFPGGVDYFKLVNVVSTSTSIDPSEYWDNHRQIDFVRSVFQIFNIIARIDKQGKLQLDSWDQFITTEGEKKDWSEKVDYPSMEASPINGELRNPVFLSLSEANNVLNIDYQNLVGRPYGSYREDQNIPGTLPEASTIKGFSPAAPQEIISSSAGANYPEVIICKYYSDEDSLAYKSPGLQLMYYNGARTIPNPIYTTNSVGGATTARTYYPYFSNFKLTSGGSWLVTSSTLDLNFTYWTPPSAIVTTPSEEGLFNRYFRDMIRERYDEGAKIIKMNVLLDAADIAEFSFADTIIVNVNGTPVGLRIVEINDYSPNSKRLTKVKAYITFIA